MTVDTLTIRAMIAVVNSKYKHSIDAQEALYEVGRLIDTYEDEESAKMAKEFDMRGARDEADSGVDR